MRGAAPGHRRGRSAQGADPTSLPWQRLLHVRQRIRKDCHNSGVFRQFFRHDLVQRVGGSVMVVEVETVVLNRTKSRHACFLEWLDVSATVLDEIKNARA